MFIDNLAFEYPAGIADIGNTVETNIFPNPAPKSHNPKIDFFIENRGKIKVSLFNLSNGLEISSKNIDFILKGIKLLNPEAEITESKEEVKEDVKEEVKEEVKEDNS